MAKHLDVQLTLLIVVLVAATCSVDNSIHDATEKNCSKLEVCSVESTPEFPIWTSYRLPTSIKPRQYDLTIILNLYGNETNKDVPIPYSGEVIISLDVEEATDFVVLHAVNMTITSAEVSENGQDYNHIDYKASMDLEQQVLRLKRQYDVGNKLKLRLLFNNTLSNSLHGFYKSVYSFTNSTNNDTQERIIATTQFESVFARHAFPCFDEPSFKAKFALKITRPHEWISLFNTPLKSSEGYDETRTMDTYGSSPLMSSYLVAFLVTDFDHTDPYNITSLLDNHTIMITVYGQRDQLSQLEFASSVTGDIIRGFEDLFQVSYPLTKMDIVAIPDFSSGAMENWGLMTFRQVALLYDPVVSSSSQQQYVASVIAHELAHQWFGNLVTMEWWNELWLNEGFATFIGQFVGAKYISDTHNYSWPVEEDFIFSVTRAFGEDSLRSSSALSQPENDTNSLADIESQFNAISYSKGAAIINMLDHFVTRNVTRAALHHYLITHRYGNAKASDLWNAFDKAYHAAHPESDTTQIRTMMTSWTDVSGYPFIEADVEEREIKVSQSQFFLCKTCNSSSDTQNVLWKVPLTYQIYEPLSLYIERILLTKQKGTIYSGNGTSAKLNVNWTGFYLVKYNNMSNVDITKLSDIDLANLVYDSLQLLKGGHVEPDVFVDLLSLVTSSSSGYLTWRVALKSMWYLLNLFDQQPQRYFMISSQVYEWLSVSRISLDYGVLENMQLQDRTILSGKLRMALSINSLNVTRDIPQIKDLAGMWTKSLGDDSYKTDSVIHKDVATDISISGFLADETGLWDALWSSYLTSLVPSEQTQYISVLSSGRNQTLLQRLLDFSLTKAPPQDTIDIITKVSSGRSGRTLGWDFIRANWNDILERFGTSGNPLSRLIVGTTSYFSDSSRLSQMNEFFETHNLGVAKRASSQALEIVQANIYMMDERSPYLLSAFENLKT